MLGSAIFALIGLSSCERMVKYGLPPEEYPEDTTTVVPEYGVLMPNDGDFDK